jgi:hypothetical protein
LLGEHFTGVQENGPEEEKDFSWAHVDVEIDLLPEFASDGDYFAQVCASEPHYLGKQLDIVGQQLEATVVGFWGGTWGHFSFFDVSHCCHRCLAKAFLI